MADQSTNIPWARGMNYGIGVNLLNGDIAGKAVDPGEITGAGGQTTRYNLTLINSFEELYSSIGISVEASGQYGLFNASGKFNYAKESKFNSQATFLLARCVVENAFTQAEDPQIKPEASELLRQGKADVFQQRYGDGFVRGMQTGGEFFAVISVTSSSQEEQKSIAASLQAKYGGLFASAGVDVNLDSSTKSKVSRSELSISTYQRGGTGDEQSLTADVEAVMARLKAFPTQVKNNPVPYDVQVASYNTLALPEGPNPIDIQAQKDALADYARIQLKLLSLRNDIEFLQLHSDFFENPPSSSTLTQWQEFVTDQLNQLQRQASKCADNPVGGCNLFAFKLPDGFSMPERKLHSSKQVTIYDNVNFEGNSQLLSEGQYAEAVVELTIGNDTLSSIKVPEGLVVRLYEHFHFQGRFIDIKVDTQNLGSFWDNKTSSIIVYEEGNPPTIKKAVIFEHSEYNASNNWVGAYQVLEKGRYDGIVKPIQAGNGLSSALVPKGMVLRLYQSQNFQGSFIEIKEDTPAIRLDWNDLTASIILYEEGEDIP